MNTIIIYSSKYGCTAECAEYLKSGLAGAVTLTDINKANFSDIGLENYDTIVLGSSIYIGAISKKMKKLCSESLNLLSKKRVGIFICCAFSEQAEEYLAANFPPTLLKSAAAIKIFGGDARTTQMKPLDKLIMKAAVKETHDKLKISHENMDSFIKALGA